MTRGRKLAVALALALAAVALIALRDGSGAPHSVDADGSGMRGPAAPTPLPATATAAHEPANTRALQARRDAGTSDVAQVLRATDVHDRALLAGIERQTKASPPDTVHQLLELRRNGATRDQLQAFIDRELSGRLPIRVAANRWLRAVLPRPGLDPERAAPPRMGGGGGPKLLQPIEAARPR